MILHAELSVGRYFSDGDRVQPPFSEYLKHFLFASALGHQQHALLRFRQHDLVRGHAGLALRNILQVDFDAGFRAAAHLASGTSQPRRAHVLDADDGASTHGFQARFEQKLLEKRIAHLHIRPLLFRFLGELGRCHGSAVNPVAARFRAYIYNRISDAFGLPVEHLVLLKDTQREDVHQRIAVVALFEDTLAAHGGHTETIAVMRDAGDHAFENSSIPRVMEWAEAQGIQYRYRPRTHGEDVAKNSAYASGRALKRLNETRMIVRFDLECNCVITADVDDAGVFSRPLQIGR